MSRADTHVREAVMLRERLKAEGNHRDAQIVDQLLRSLRTARTTLGVLHGDNRRLREKRR